MKKKIEGEIGKILRFKEGKEELKKEKVGERKFEELKVILVRRIEKKRILGMIVENKEIGEEDLMVLGEGKGSIIEKKMIEDSIEEIRIEMIKRLDGLIEGENILKEEEKKKIMRRLDWREGIRKKKLKRKDE